MLRGERVALRARQESDLPVLLEELYNDVETRVRADARPWIPIPVEAKKNPYAVEDEQASEACFSVVDLETDELVGEALLWGIDQHNRLAHLGMSIRPRFRGQGYAVDIMRVLCGYGFAIRGLNRLQIDTLADNEAVLRTAAKVGCTREGPLRQNAWVNGAFLDEAILGLLADDWHR